MTVATTTTQLPTRIAARFTLIGRVQGIGMRPAVARFARQLRLTGYVGNTHEGVEIHVEGPTHDVERFQRISSDEICYPQPFALPNVGILELFTKYTGVRELYWNLRRPDGSRGEDRKLAGMGGGNDDAVDRRAAGVS